MLPDDADDADADASMAVPKPAKLVAGGRSESTTVDISYNRHAAFESLNASKLLNANLIKVYANTAWTSFSGKPVTYAKLCGNSK